MPIDLRKKLNTDDPKWDKVKSNLKKVETKTWRVLDPIGQWSNRTAGKFGAESFWPTELPLELDKAARILRTFTTQGAQVEVDASNAAAVSDQTAVVPPSPSTRADGRPIKDPHKYDSRKTQKVIRKISPKVLAKAHGIAIFTVFRTGFGFSGASGSGVILSRLPDGSWSPPSGLLVHTIGWGFLIGLDIYDVVLVLRNQKAVDAFKRPKISLGGELSVAAGPVGNGAMLDAGVEGAPCWSYTKSKGLYAGLQLDGNIILKRDDANARFYQSPGITVADILSGNLGAPAPPACIPLWQTLYAAEGRPQVMGVDRIPQGGTPGDLQLTQEDMKDASLLAEQDMHRFSTSTATAAGSSLGSEAGASASASGVSRMPSDRKVPPPPTPTQGGAASGDAPYSDLPPDYDFANTPVNAQGGKTFSDAPSEHTNRPAAAVVGTGPDAPPNPFAGGPETDSAADEKERLRQHYAAEDAAAAAAAASASVASTSNLPSRVEAQHNFDAQEDGDLGFVAGDVIEVIGQEDDMWWRGKMGSRTGIFPSNYTRPL